MGSSSNNADSPSERQRSPSAAGSLPKTVLPPKPEDEAVDTRAPTTHTSKEATDAQPTSRDPKAAWKQLVVKSIDFLEQNRTMLSTGSLVVIASSAYMLLAIGEVPGVRRYSTLLDIPLQHRHRRIPVIVKRVDYAPSGGGVPVVHAEHWPFMHRLRSVQARARGASSSGLSETSHTLEFGLAGVKNTAPVGVQWMETALRRRVSHLVLVPDSGGAGSQTAWYARLEARVHQPLTPKWRALVPPISRLDVAQALVEEGLARPASRDATEPTADVEHVLVDLPYAYEAQLRLSEAVARQKGKGMWARRRRTWREWLLEQLTGRRNRQ